jgi:hypothetical protein
MTHLGLTPLDFYYVFPSYRVEPAPISEFIHKLTLAVNRPIGIKVCLFCNWRLTACPASPFTPIWDPFTPKVVTSLPLAPKAVKIRSGNLLSEANPGS